MKKLICITIGLIVLVSVVMEVQAQDRKQMWSDPVTVFRPLKKTEQKTIADSLALTPDQQKEIKTLSQKYMTELKALADTYQKARQDVMAALEAESPDREAVANGLKQVQETHSDLLKKEVEYWHSLTSVLNDDQVAQFWSLFADSRMKAPTPTEEIVAPEEEEL